MSPPNPNKIGCLTPQTSSKPTALWWGTWPLTHCKWHLNFKTFLNQPIDSQSFFTKNIFCEHFRDFQAAYVYSKRHLQHDSMPFFLSSITFYHNFAQACVEMKIFKILKNFCLPFFSFSYLQWLTFYWACFHFKNFSESIPETGKFCCGIATFIFHLFQASLTQSLWSRHHWKDVFLL